MAKFRMAYNYPSYGRVDYMGGRQGFMRTGNNLSAEQRFTLVLISGILIVTGVLIMFWNAPFLWFGIDTPIIGHGFYFTLVGIFSRIIIPIAFYLLGGWLITNAFKT